MFRYVAYYNYSSIIYDYDEYDNMIEQQIDLDESNIQEINEIFMTDTNMNPMMNDIFHDCVSKGTWKKVPIELDKKIKGWNWKLKDNTLGYVELLSEEPLTQEELDIMTKETESQITDGYNENPFEFNILGQCIYITFNNKPIKDFIEE